MKLIITTILLAYSVCLSQTYMHIKNKDGTTQTFNIEEIRKLTFSGIVSVEDGEKAAAVLRTFSLLQNYPNPANPTTTIEYQIPEAGDVEVSIYDVTGKIVTVLEKNYKNAGNYKLKWDGKNDSGLIVSSGIYIYRINFNNNILAKKLIIMK